MAGKNENELTKMLHYYGAFVTKQEDKRFCPNCGREVYKPRESSEDGGQIKASKVDYLVQIKERATWIEVKWGKDSFQFADKGMGLHQNQRLWMDYWELWGVPCWLFLGVGPGPAPAHRHTWLIPWTQWLRIEAPTVELAMKSIPYKPTVRLISKTMNCISLFAPWVLKWEKSIGWTIPENHDFAKSYPEIFGLPVLFPKE